MPTTWRPRPLRPLSPALEIIVADLQQLEAIVPPERMIDFAKAMRNILLWQQETQETTRRPPRRPRPA